MGIGFRHIAKNSGWQIVLISFVTFLHQGRKVSAKKCKEPFLWVDYLHIVDGIRALTNVFDKKSHKYEQDQNYLIDLKWLKEITSPNGKHPAEVPRDQ